ncbi:pyridoxal phosphate-dependent aminotransferase [Aeromicrobium wangtongii]|uniref:Pyridoxal phosphate-dependent aminotransferase n=1 Tax=Aeromicrobium wangtongii TaxID=2969247 RepID=A0ABY5MA71_9ACTN|nr:pyridoxal phosphate-dependent aminotransferase [Aeromicrobium wangtongii]MCD9199668.1 pyridoxal phosphate-dependent aminotransferase [Aeromicrobium wangtongii]UUP14019.1 pyridoxal phosphate-dependent aminotransferase [Aeromicrobium wangtongii]
MKTSSSRIAGLGTTIFAEMSQLALRHDAVNLGQGFPDTDGPGEVIERAVDALRTGRNQYAPGIGVPELRAAIAAHQQRFYGLVVDPDTEVAVATGATEAIASALLGLIDPGDEVIALEPYYDSYVAMLQMTGAVRRPVTLRAPHFRLPIDELRAAVSPRTTAILLNSPHNPTGTVLRREELDAIAAIAIEHDLVVISDEVYEHLTFDGLPHIPIASLPGMAERTLTISSGGKSFSFTGWKIGWATGPAPLVRAMTGAKQFLTYTSGSPLQPAIAHALEADDSYFADFTARLQSQRDRLCDGLAEIGFDVLVPEGTYFATTDIRPLGFDDGLEFCRMLPGRAGVVAIPHQVFHDPSSHGRADDPGRPLVRWAFCKRPEVIAEALQRLQAVRS